MSINVFVHPTHELISDCIRAHHCWEPVLTELLHELLQRVVNHTDGDGSYAFVDVGANLGYFTCWVGACTKLMRIVAFEPMHANLQLLRQNVVVNQLESRVTVCPYAVGNQGDCIKTYFAPAHNMGLCTRVGSVLDAQVSGQKLQEWVQERSLLLCLSRELSPDIQKYIMKMDVEEAELDVLGTFTPALWDAVHVLIVEIAAAHFYAVMHMLEPHFARGIQLGCVTSTQRVLNLNSCRLQTTVMKTMEELRNDGNGGIQCNIILFKQPLLTRT